MGTAKFAAPSLRGLQLLMPRGLEEVVSAAADTSPLKLAKASPTPLALFNSVDPEDEVVRVWCAPPPYHFLSLAVLGI